MDGTEDYRQEMMRGGAQDGVRRSSPMVSQKNTDLELDKIVFKGKKENKVLSDIGTIHSKFVCNVELQANEELGVKACQQTSESGPWVFPKGKEEKTIDIHIVFRLVKVSRC